MARVSRRIRVTEYECDTCRGRYATAAEANECAARDERDSVGEWMRKHVGETVDCLWFIDTRPQAEAFVAELKALVERYKPQNGS